MRSWEAIRNEDRPVTELIELARRHGRVYSFGHQKMYTAPIELLAHEPARILDIGCGVGFGAECMAKQECVKRYLGIDLAPDCIKYCVEQFGGYDDLEFRTAEWPLDLHETFDFVFLIEVIEHVEEELRQAFLNAIRGVCEVVLFLSTPNPEKHGHGRCKPGDMRDMLRIAGFNAVILEWQWTTFYMAQ